MSATFLGGAKNRLLPASVPYSFFLSGALFHVLAWGMLFVGAEQVPGFTGGTGPVLAAIHLLTIGVLATTAMGASYQLLPVVTRRGLVRVWPARLSLWLIVPGVLVLSHGMASADQSALVIGAGLVGTALMLFVAITTDNLFRASGVAIVAAHGWAAITALVGVVCLGVMLVFDYELGYLGDHSAIAQFHMILAVFGFMGLLVMGLSLILVPMFVLSRSPSDHLGWGQLIFVLVSLVAFALGMIFNASGLSVMIYLSALAAVTSHSWLMRTALKTGMRRQLGVSFVLIRASWGFLGLGLLIGLAVELGLPLPGGAALFGFVVLVGWLLTFMTGVLQRIIPFLASMHAVGSSDIPPTLSQLTTQRPLKLHAVCHFLALTLCGLGILSDLTVLIEIGSVIGGVGALGFAGFAVTVAVKVRGYSRVP